MPKGIASFTDEPFLLNMINKKQLAKHFAGQHDQSTHGSWAHGDVNDFTLDSRFQDAIKTLSTRDVDDDNFKETEVGKFLTEYVEKTIDDSLVLSGWDTITPKDLQYRSMQERLKDEIDAYSEIKKEDTYKSFEDDVLPEVVSAMENGKICIAMDVDSFGIMMESGDPRFKTQFEIAKSNGHYNPTIRRSGEARSQSVPVSVNDTERPIYGYLSIDDFDESVTTYGVAQYGEIRFVLKDYLKDRSTMTIGDSLNTGTIPMKLNKTPSTSDAMKASEITVRGYPWQWSGAEDFTDKSYFETQIFGGISLKDVEKIYVPYGNMDFDADAFAKLFPDIEFVGYDS
jgi:formylmethanofuran dehydrogenase subunit C